MQAKIEKANMYKNPVPVAVCVAHVRVNEEIKLLGIIRVKEPTVGTLPGGYVAKGESVEEGASRKFSQEVGIATRPEDWTPFTSCCSPDNRVLVSCLLNRVLDYSEVKDLPIASPEVLGYTIIEPTPEPAVSLRQAIAEAYPIPVAVCLIRVRIEENIKLFGVVRANEPGVGGKAMGGGYVDEGESFEEAACRECGEEFGIITRPEDWKLFASLCSPLNRVLGFCLLDRVFDYSEIKDLPIASPEVLGYAIIEPTTELVFSLHQAIAKKFFNGDIALLK